MVLTTADLVHDLERIEHLIALMTEAASFDGPDLGDLGWLINMRQDLTALLALRRALKGEKIVDLELWRVGFARPPMHATGTA